MSNYKLSKLFLETSGIQNKRMISKRPKKPIKLAIETLIFIFIGTSLTLFLNSLSEKITFSTYAAEFWANFTEGLSLLIESAFIIAKASSVLLLFILCILFLIGGSIRLLKLFSLLSRMLFRKKKPKIFINRR